jgi:hypothetical protein
VEKNLDDIYNRNSITVIFTFADNFTSMRVMKKNLVKLIFLSGLLVVGMSSKLFAQSYPTLHFCLGVNADGTMQGEDSVFSIPPGGGYITFYVQSSYNYQTGAWVPFNAYKADFDIDDPSNPPADPFDNYSYVISENLQPNWVEFSKQVWFNHADTFHVSVYLDNSNSPTIFWEHVIITQQPYNNPSYSNPPQQTYNYTPAPKLVLNEDFYSAFSVGVILPQGLFAQQIPGTITYFSDLTLPFKGQEGLGATTGFNFEYSLFASFNKPQPGSDLPIRIGLQFGFDFGYIPLNWSNVNWSNYNMTLSTSPFLYAGLKIGPEFNINPIKSLGIGIYVTADPFITIPGGRLPRIKAQQAPIAIPVLMMLAIQPLLV